MAAFSLEPATRFQQLKETPWVNVTPVLRPRMIAAKQLESQQRRATAAQRQPELPAQRAWQSDKPVSGVCCSIRTLLVPSRVRWASEPRLCSYRSTRK